MEIKKEANGSELVVFVEGRLDSLSAPTLENDLKESLEGIDSLVFDFAKLDYISSAGLRVLLSCGKTMSKKGKMVIRHVNEEVNSVFELTGFSDILDIE